jgi:hypothetical protein
MSAAQAEILEDGTLLASEEQQKAWSIGGKLMVGLCCAGLVSCAVESRFTDEPQIHTEAALTPEAERAWLEEKVASDAVLPMARSDYSDTYHRLGKAQFGKANDLMRWAALAAAKNEGCDQVILVGISASATRTQLRWYVDCANKQRLDIRESEAEELRLRLGASDAPTGGRIK